VEDTTTQKKQIQGQFLIAKPAGLFEFRGSLELVKENWSIKDFLSDFKVEDVRELNSLTRGLIPVRFKSGTLLGGMKGELAPEKINLTVELDFDKLDMESTGGKDEKFMQVPTSVYLNYISKNNGDLDLQFRLSGSPASPKIDTTKVRNRILVNIGVEAAVLGTLGLPVFIGDKVVGSVTGFSIINEARDQISNIFLKEDKKQKLSIPKTDFRPRKDTHPVVNGKQ
jgi:hypothetical protein